MLSAEKLKIEVDAYQVLAEQLKADYGALDDETLADTLEGLSDLPQMIEEVVRSSVEDQVLIEALRRRLDDMGDRLGRLKERFERKRQLACWAMGSAGIERLQAEDFSALLKPGSARVEVLEEGKLPETYLVPQPAKVDRAGLLTALKAGASIEGAILAYGAPHIAVRTK